MLSSPLTLPHRFLGTSLFDESSFGYQKKITPMGIIQNDRSHHEIGVLLVLASLTSEIGASRAIGKTRKTGGPTTERNRGGSLSYLQCLRASKGARLALCALVVLVSDRLVAALPLCDALRSVVLSPFQERNCREKQSKEGAPRKSGSTALIA